MNKIIKNNLINLLIYPEISNKFLLLKKIKLASPILCNHFKFTDIKLIKNLISLEQLSGKRPKLTVMILNKSWLIDLRTNLSVELISYLQAKPVIWSSSLDSTVNLTSKLFCPSLVVRNNKHQFIMINIKESKLTQFAKSAYLD